MPVALGIALSASCGFRIFIPLLVASAAAYFGYLPMSSGFEWMAGLPAVICFSVAAMLEVAAYYVPVIDNLLDTITTPMAIVAGTVVSAAAFVDMDPMWKWILAIVAGGGTAGVIQAGTGILRLGSTKLTAGFGNPVVATAEIVLSAIGSLMSLILPLLTALMFILLVIWIFYYSIKKLARKSP